MARPGHLVVLLGLVGILLASNEARSEAPVGQMTWAVHTTLVPAWLDPADNIQQTPFMVQLALHDALVKPLPGKSLAPSLAESWSASSDGLVYEFVLRRARPPRRLWVFGSLRGREAEEPVTGRP